MLNWHTGLCVLGRHSLVSKILGPALAYGLPCKSRSSLISDPQDPLKKLSKANWPWFLQLKLNRNLLSGRLTPKTSHSSGPRSNRTLQYLAEISQYSGLQMQHRSLSHRNYFRDSVHEAFYVCFFLQRACSRELERGQFPWNSLVI